MDWGVPILVQAKFKVCAGVHSGPKGPVIDINISICGGLLGALGNMFKRLTVWRPQCLCKQNLKFALGYVLGRRALSLICRSLASNPCPTKFRVCVGVDSGPKGPVIHILICGGAPGRLGNMFKRSTAWRPQGLPKQTLRFALGYVLGRSALSLIF